MKYLKTIIFESILILSMLIITTILYYFNITSNNINNVLNIIVFILIFILTGMYIGKRSSKRFYLEGIKIAGINILLFLILTLIFRLGFSFKNILYYLIIILLTSFGSILGSLLKKKK